MLGTSRFLKKRVKRNSTPQDLELLKDIGLRKLFLSHPCIVYIRCCVSVSDVSLAYRHTFH